MKTNYDKKYNAAILIMFVILLITCVLYIVKEYKDIKMTLGDDITYAKVTIEKTPIISEVDYDNIQQEMFGAVHASSYVTEHEGTFKSFMDYRTITDDTSVQYMLQDKYAHTGNYGIRMVGNRYCVALGSYFASDIGRCFDLILGNGVVIECVLADQKDDADTNTDNMVTVSNNCISEFVVDTEFLNEEVRLHGDVSYCNDNWNSPVVKVVVYDKNILNEQ